MDDVARYLGSDLPALLDLIDGSDIRELHLRDGDIHIRLHRTEVSEGALPPANNISPEVSEPARALTAITSPLVGTFYRASSPGMSPFVEEGSVLAESTVVGIVEVLQVLTEVRAGCRGQVVAVMATDGQHVQYGQPLFEVEVGD